MKILRSCLITAIVGLPLLAQSAERSWSWGASLDLRANYRDSHRDRFQLRFPFRPDMLPPGESFGFEETVDAGQHWEASLVTLKLDARFGDIFAARAKIDAIDLYDRNPTSGDRKADVDELWFRFGQKPEGLNLPSGTSLFIQIGKAPKMERQPALLLESYGLAHTAFNRMEDTQLLIGGSIGRHVYWRGQYSRGNPVFFRDPNALAGDNGVDVLRTPFPNPNLKSGFPILYGAEVDSLGFGDSETMESGAGLGYRWLSDDLAKGFDLIGYHYERDLADEVDVYGTFYGGDLDLLDGVPPHSIATHGRRKTKSGARFYGEWQGGRLIAQYVREDIAGLKRDGFEIESGWRFATAYGPTMGGAPLVSSIQPALRYSELDNHFRGEPTYPAPSVWWDWQKIDVGVRVGVGRHLEVTIERSFHDIKIPVDLDVDEMLVSLRVKLGSRG